MLLNNFAYTSDTNGFLFYESCILVYIYFVNSHDLLAI